MFGSPFFLVSPRQSTKENREKPLFESFYTKLRNDLTPAPAVRKPGIRGSFLLVTDPLGVQPEELNDNLANLGHLPMWVTSFCMAPWVVSYLNGVTDWKYKVKLLFGNFSYQFHVKVFRIVMNMLGPFCLNFVEFRVAKFIVSACPFILH